MTVVNSQGKIAPWVKIALPIFGASLVLLGMFLNHVVELTTTQTQQTDQIRINTLRLDKLEEWQREIDNRLTKMEVHQEQALRGIDEIKDALRDHEAKARKRAND